MPIYGIGDEYLIDPKEGFDEVPPFAAIGIIAP
jgi:hypothetical protein